MFLFLFMEETMNGKVNIIRKEKMEAFIQKLSHLPEYIKSKLDPEGDFVNNSLS